MIFAPRRSRVIDQRLVLTAANFAAQSISVPLPTNQPLEEIRIVLNITMAATAFTDQYAHGLCSILKKVTLTTNNGIKPETPVSVSGAGLLQLVANEALTLPRSTQAVIATLGQGYTPASAVYRITYRIPLVHPLVTGALRARMLLPVHLHNEPPVLNMDFGAASDMFSSTTNPFVSVVPEVYLVRRVIPKDFADYIVKQSPGGDPRLWFINSDIVESFNSVPANQTDTAYRCDIKTPGQYASLLIYHLKGNAALTCADISASSAIGTETDWSVVSDEVALDTFRMKHMQDLNDESRCTLPASVFNNNVVTLNAAKTAGTAANTTTANIAVGNAQFGGALGTGFGVQDPYSVFLDRLTDGLTDADELGSLLDCNLPVREGLKMELVGRVTTPASQASQINIVGRRFFGDLSRWQTVERVA